ncbi:MAG: TonB-dependent receptor plug domain-containing protein, partial [Colwellia sp.]|nr:TonB-dependent receptor plug domain-containing protein [Colwellia sp.]
IAKKTGKNLFFPAEKLADITSNKLVGTYTLAEALVIILADTNVEASVTKKGVIVVHTRRKKAEENKKEEGFWASLFSSQDDALENEQRRIERQAKDEVERIAVTGYRESLNKALSFKKNADYQVDVISAEDIGKLPDVEVGDVLERIAGVQVKRGDDGVVNGTSIRGLPGYFNRTLYNDHVINTSLSTERFFDSQIMPAAFVSRIEVQKTAQADVIEGGLAGVINLKSIRAFDIGETAARLHLTGTGTSNDHNHNSDIVAIFSDLYLNDTLGISTGINVLKSDTESQKGVVFNPVTKLTEGEGKDYDGDGEVENGDVFYVPQAISYILNENSRERNAAFLNIEWRPTPTFNVFGEVFFSGYDTLNIRNNLKFRPRAANESTGEGAQVSQYEGALYPNGARDYLTVYHPSNIFAEVLNQYNYRESDIIVALFDMEWLHQRWTFNLSGNISKSKTNQFTIEAKNLTAKDYFDITLDGTQLDKAWGVYFHNPDGDPDYSQRGLLNDPQAPFRSLTVNAQQVGGEYESNTWAADFSAQYEFEHMDSYISVTSLQLGLHYSEDESLANQPRANFFGDTEGLFNGAEMTYSTVEPARGQWFDYDANQPGAPLAWAVPDISTMVTDYNWTADSVRAAAIDAEVYQPGIRDDLKEDIVAAFIKLNFENDSGLLTGNFGLRYIKTKQFASGQGG